MTAAAEPSRVPRIHVIATQGNDTHHLETFAKLQFGTVTVKVHYHQTDESTASAHR